MIYLLIGYMWLFIHRPFEIWPWLAELRIERVYMLITIAYWMAQPKSWTANRLNTGVGLLAAAILVSAVLSPYEGLESQVVQNWFKLLVFYILVLTSIRNLDDLKALIVAFVMIMGLYELHSLREYFNGRGVYRMGIWRMVGVDSSLNDPNSFSASILYGLPVLLPVAALATEKWQRRALWGLLALGLACIALTGSRTAFAAIILFSVGLGMRSAHRWRILASLVIAAPLVWVNLSEDLQNRYLTLIDPSRGPANAQESADSRERFFFMALDIWKENPLFGVGPRGFAYASGTGMQSHSLYAETISELGLLGIVAVATLVGGFYLNFREARKLHQIAEPTINVLFLYRTVLAIGIAVLLLLFLGLAEHNLIRYTWLWYAAFSALALKFLHEAVAEQARDEVATELEYEPTSPATLVERGLFSERGPTAAGI
jgi:O-antigen ligase